MEIEHRRDLNNTIVHVDMDAFYAAVEMRDTPELKDKPIAVGSMSMLVKEILADYDPNFMAMSLDEAYLNITKHLQERQNWPEEKRSYFIKTGNLAENDEPGKEVNKLSESDRSISPLLFEDSPPDLQSPGHPCQVNSEEQNNPQIPQNSVVFGTSAEEVVKEIRFRIEQKTTLTASADPLLLPVQRIQVVEYQIVSSRFPLRLLTFNEINKAEEQYDLCQELCRELAQDLQKEGLKGRTVTVKLKNVNFEVKTRASTVSSVVSTTEEIFAIAKELLRTEIDADFPYPLRLRLMGMSNKVQKTVAKTKRPGLMTKYSTSKKIKPNNPRHTLDIFFK
ncbi:DNA polymerase kappa [Heterocephalus glaber]|uniref:DNA-directed DNA polymerase n=1 Tax=Heterocephalus glaber TaxID=10181 RepID=G5AK82_HETGA|nr:DNA polymerase kappa [Heterocephalus glaber]